jgi:hypothetical protein
MSRFLGTWSRGETQGGRLQWEQGMNLPVEWDARATGATYCVALIALRRDGFRVMLYRAFLHTAKRVLEQPISHGFYDSLG